MRVRPVIRIDVVVSPITGMGGRVSLKETDGRIAEARVHDTEPQSPERAQRALSRPFETAPEVELLAWGDEMGMVAARDTDFDPEAFDEPSGDEMSATDTVAAAEAFVDADADLVLFIGGDGTAADAAEVPDKTDVPMLGVSASARVYPSVSAVSPEDAAHVVTSFERTEACKAIGIDKSDYHDGEVRPELQVVAHVPVAEDFQSSKRTGGGTVESLAVGAADDIRSTESVTYVLGPGSTVGAVKTELRIDGSPLGVDIYRDGEVLTHGATETETLTNLGTENVIVATPIGGQGLVLGRGNPRLSPAVVRRYGVSAVVSRPKLDRIFVSRVGIDDPDLDADLRGWVKVRVGRVERRMTKTE